MSTNDAPMSPDDLAAALADLVVRYTAGRDGAEACAFLVDNFAPMADLAVANHFGIEE